jgi:very-short-patch-repair endonuclease
MTDVVEDLGGIRPQVRPADREIAEVAYRQHGLVTHRQLVELGFGPAAIQHRLRARRLHRVHRGVYAVGHANVSGLGRLMAAVLAFGGSAVLSHRTAAALWGIRSNNRQSIDVTTLRCNHGRRPGLAVHLVRNLAAEDRTSVQGIPVTTVARTLLDLAEVLPRTALMRVVEEAERLQVFDLRSVDALLGRSRGRLSVGRLKSALLAYRELPHMTRSELERRFLSMCRDAGLPAPTSNAWILDQEVDALWAAQRLVVELDGHGYHRTRAAFERDRIRDTVLQLAGYRVLRVTQRRLECEPSAVMAGIRSLLGSTAPLPSARP